MIFCHHPEKKVIFSHLSLSTSLYLCNLWKFLTAEVNESQVTKPQRDGGVILNKGLSRGVSRELLMNGGIMTQKTPGCAKGNATNVTPRVRGNSQKLYIYYIYIQEYNVQSLPECSVRMCLHVCFQIIITVECLKAVGAVKDLFFTLNRIILSRLLYQHHLK